MQIIVSYCLSRPKTTMSRNYHQFSQKTIRFYAPIKANYLTKVKVRWSESPWRERYHAKGWSGLSNSHHIHRGEWVRMFCYKWFLQAMPLLCHTEKQKRFNQKIGPDHAIVGIVRPLTQDSTDDSLQIDVFAWDSSAESFHALRHQLCLASSHNFFIFLCKVLQFYRALLQLCCLVPVWMSQPHQSFLPFKTKQYLQSSFKRHVVKHTSRRWRSRPVPRVSVSVQIWQGDRRVSKQGGGV